MTKQKIRESLNRFDNKALDECTKYYDLVNLYEAAAMDINAEANTKLVQLIESKNEKGIHDLLSRLLSEEFDMGEEFVEEEFNNFDDLDESRNTLKPVKCKALASHKTYWSPYDTKEQDFAKFGIRFRYEDKESCQDAINDPDKDLGYDKNSKKGHTKIQGDEEIVEEGMINEVKYNDKFVNKGDTKVTTDPILIQDVQALLTRGLKPSTGVPVGVWIAIKLYQLTDNGTDLSKGVSRKDLNILTGTPPERQDVDAQNNTTYMHLSNGWTKKDGTVVEGEHLMRSSHGMMYPTERLKPWIEGDNAFPDGTHGIDFRKFIGGEKDPENNIPRQYQINTSLKSPYGRGEKDEEDRPGYKKAVNPNSGFVKATPKAEPVPEEPAKQEEPTEEMPTFDMSMFEGINIMPKDINLNEDFEKKEKYCRAYRKYMNLDEDADIESNFDETCFRNMCANHGWTFDKTRRIMLGR